MGRYRKKPYKKQQIDIYYYKSIEDEIEDELDLFFNPNQEESVLFLDEEPLLFSDEPEIVKQLREEELQGKLPMWLADFNKEDGNDFKSEEQDSKKETESNQSEENLQTGLITKKLKD
jgi:hypothetical protein